MRYKDIHIRSFPIKNSVKHFCYEMLIRTRRRSYVYQLLFYFLNVGVFALALFVVIISTLRMGNLSFFLSNNTTDANLYVYVTTAISTISSFLGSMISFFLIKDAYYKNKRNYNKIKSELTQFKLKIGRYYGLESGVDSDTLLFENVCKILNFSPRLRDDSSNDFIQILNKPIDESEDILKDSGDKDD